jgi:hypothetical protein
MKIHHGLLIAAAVACSIPGTDLGELMRQRWRERFVAFWSAGVATWKTSWAKRMTHRIYEQDQYRLAEGRSAEAERAG